jgi:hypothetical protein
MLMAHLIEVLLQGALARLKKLLPVWIVVRGKSHFMLKRQYDDRLIDCPAVKTGSARANDTPIRQFAIILTRQRAIVTVPPEHQSPHESKALAISSGRSI